MRRITWLAVAPVLLLAACGGPVVVDDVPVDGFLAQRDDGSIVVLDRDLVETRMLQPAGTPLMPAQAPVCGAESFPGVTGCLDADPVLVDFASGAARLVTASGVDLGDWSGIVRDAHATGRVYVVARGVATVELPSQRPFVVEQAFGDAPVMRALPGSVRWAVPIP